jgi:hypothetical protein
VVYAPAESPDTLRALLLYPTGSPTLFHAMIAPLWDRPDTHTTRMIREMEALRSRRTAVAMGRAARSADPMARAKVLRTLLEAYGATAFDAWRPNGRRVDDDPRPTPTEELEAWLGVALATARQSARRR